MCIRKHGSVFVRHSFVFVMPDSTSRILLYPAYELLNSQMVFIIYAKYLYNYHFLRSDLIFDRVC